MWEIIDATLKHSADNSGSVQHKLFCDPQNNGLGVLKCPQVCACENACACTAALHCVTSLRNTTGRAYGICTKTRWAAHTRQSVVNNFFSDLGPVKCLLHCHSRHPWASFASNIFQTSPINQIIWIITRRPVEIISL